MADDPYRKLPASLERRNHARRTVIESRLIAVDIGESARGVLIDAGEGGVAVQPFVPLPVGAESDIVFETPNGARVKAHGMVAWVGENGRTGIRFVDVEPEGLSEIRRWTEEGDNSQPTATFVLSTLPSLEVLPAGDIRPHPVDVEARCTSLEAIVEEACRLTRAEGAAVALHRAGQVRCVAMVGNAPDVGVAVAREEGLACECLRTGQPLVCCDARSDRRVNRAAVLSLNLGSCAIAPVRAGGEVVGLLAVFSTRAEAFDEQDLSALVDLAGNVPHGIASGAQ